MKTKTRNLITFLFALVVACCIASGDAKAASVDDLTFELNKDGNSYCVDDCDGSASGELVIPATHLGKPVTSIGDYAFSSCDSLTSVTISSGVTAIGSSAFWNCSRLTSVTIPNSVTYIGRDAFFWCSSLKFNVFDNGKYLGNASNPYLALIKTTSYDIATFTIHNKTRIIYSDTFSNCDSLSSVTIPDSVTSIGEYAFCGCTSLTSVTIPDSVTFIDDAAFRDCDSLTSVHISDIAAWCNINFNSYNATPLRNGANLYLNGNLVKELVIPDGVSSIGNHAFSYCNSLTSVTIPDSVTSIGSSAFYSCDSLTSVHISDIAAWCSIDFNSSDANPLYNRANLYLNGELVQELVIPDGVTSIGYGAFSGCNSLTSVSIPDSVTYIGSSAFEYCTSLTSVTIPDSVTEIGRWAFCYCTSLTNVTIPESINTIGYAAFSACDSLIYDIYENCKYLGNAKNPYVVLIDAPNDITSCTINSKTKIIAPNAFSGCTRLTKVTIPNSVTHLGDYAFERCTNLTCVNIPESVTEYGLHLFDSCTSLTSMTIPNGATIIQSRMFLGCTNLTSVYIPDSVRSISYYAFDDCTSLKKVYYGGSQAQWNEISIATDTGMGAYCNESLIAAEKIYNYKIYNRSATVISTGGANIWSKPYTSNDSKKIRTAAYNSKLNVVGKVVNSAGNLWYQLSDGNWVYSTNIRVTDYNPADMQAINKTVVVTSWGANIWSKPYSSGDSKVAYSAEKTAALKVVAQVKNSTGGLWYMLEDGNWIYSKNVNERIFDPADVIAYKRSATVIVPGVINIWGQPSTKAPSTLTRTAAYQTKLNVVAKYTTPSGGVWYQLTDGNWVYSTNIRITDYNPADVQKVNKTVTVTSWGANIWSKPYSSGDSKVVKTVAKAANLKIDGQVRNSTYGLWYHLADGSGWIYSQNVKVK